MKIFYQDSACVIIHGDSREIVPTLKPSMFWPECGDKFDLLLTDPPFGIGFAAQPTTGQRQRGMKPETWDEKSPCLKSSFAISENQIVWGGNYFKLPISRGWLAWCKPDAPPSMGNLELAWTSRDATAKHIIQSIAATNPERLGHPTQKPLAVILWSLSFFQNAQTIIDPFAGSCTTGRAAKDLGRKCVMIEREEKYCEIGAKRMHQEVLAL